MKKNKTMRFASVLLIMTLITSCFVGSTFAKYTSTTTGTDSARVAKWDINVNDGDISTEFTFDLFKTIKDTDGNSETDLSDTSGAIIAPGTAGEFAIQLDNKSEVPAKYAIDYTVDNTASIPIKFSVDGRTWTSNLSDVAASDDAKLAHTNGTETITVQWQWAFDGNNDIDTNLGKDGTATITVTAKITAEQVD